VAEVRFHPEADEEYREALIWYQTRSPQSADRFEAEVERVAGEIAARPLMFPKYDDDHRFALLHYFPYSLVYRPTPDDILVVAVAHSHRRPGYWQGRT
jgi:plasmid stabilization system protein ParE